MSNANQIKKALKTSLFTVLAAGLVSYTIYWGGNYVQSSWGIEISHLVYSIIWCIAMAFVLHFTAGDFLKELNDVSQKKQRNKY